MPSRPSSITDSPNPLALRDTAPLLPNSRGGRKKGDGTPTDVSRPATVAILTPEQQLAKNHKDLAIRSARAAIDEQEVEEEINLTLWEQADWKAKIYAIVESGSFPSDIPRSVERAAIFVALVTSAVILLSCVSILALSYPIYMTSSSSLWSAVEVFCVVVFTMDLILRLITCPSKQRFFYDFFNWVDMVSILPYYLGLFGTSNFPWYIRIVRALRIARMVKVLRSRGILGLKALLQTVQDSITGVILFFIVAGTGMLIFSTMMYFSERGVFDSATYLWWRECPSYSSCSYPSWRVTNASNRSVNTSNVTLLVNATNSNHTNLTTAAPTTFPPMLNSNHSGFEISPFQSIAGSFWFTIQTMTTVGTGEIEGTSMAGRFVTGMMSFAGIFFIGVPTMVLAGNHVARKVQATERTVRNSWEDLQRKKKRLMNVVLGSLDLLMRYYGWSGSPQDISVGGSAVTDNKDADQDLLDENERGALQIVPNTGANSVDGSKLSVPSSRGGKQQPRIVGNTTRPHAAIVVGLYQSGGKVREVRQSMIDSMEYLYEPVLELESGPDGRPRGEVLWANNDQSTLVQFNLILDDDETRNAVVKVVGQLNPEARIRCDSHSGFSVRHYSPLDTLRTQVVQSDGSEFVQSVRRWEMLPVTARNGFRGRIFPLFFRRIGGDWGDPLAHQTDKNRFSEDELVEDALASLMGSSLLIENYIPIPPVRRRVMVVTQFLQFTKLHRELELCAHLGKDVPYEELTAFITDSDFRRLLEGVARRVELIDQSLVVEDLGVVETKIADVILRGLRRIRVVQIPQRFKLCIYNSEVLEQDDLVYEVPLSLFLADEDDVVEQDAIGYVEVTARAAYGRASRLDFGVNTRSKIMDSGSKSFIMSN